MHELETTLMFLERLVEDRRQLLEIPEAERQRLLTLVGRLANPTRFERRQVSRAGRRRDRQTRKENDQAVLNQTQIRALRRAPVFETPPLEDQAIHPDVEVEPDRVLRPRACYVCKEKFDDIHFHYDAMCPSCADFNWRKRQQSADLSGRVALVTGARVKIGYQAAIKLLRAGARVIVTTRFPRDAALRYAREADYGAWGGRLRIHGLDLRHTPSVEAFCKRLLAEEERLDFIINNACQTVRRPSGFYAHLMAAERGPLDALPGPARRLLTAHERALTPERATTLGLDHAAALSQVPLLEEDLGRDLRLFPQGELDADLQQVDLRVHNSWRAEMHEVSAVELLEVHLVNAVAPFILNARLKPLMARRPEADKHIVNVSAVEGQFYRRWKTHRHPHTNMAKASLNMMTRTAAADYVREGIHINSVDTGWVTDEDPAARATIKREIHDFHPPLDIVDGAARICDPIFHGINTGEHLWGRFLKDYQTAPW
ncbi:SDR family oxidoreductase [Myxococcota bacterium]|nr:SDR family oxidoreductase [Myxococcota bacterium]